MANRNDKLESRSTKAKSSQKARKFPYYRQLKVRWSLYYYQYGDFQPRHRYRPIRPVPWINIKGYWLNEAGFSIDTPLQVKISKGRITLTVIQVSPSV